MNIWRLSIREIAHRKLNFISGLISVAVAVGCLVGAMTLLAGHDLRTEQVIAQKEAETKQAMVQMEDDYRVIMKRMGYNVLILHRDEDFAELHRRGFPVHFMPEDYAFKLAEQQFDSLNHILPILQQEMVWPEHDRTVIATGVRGQVYRKSARQTPIMEPVPPGEVKLGADLAADLGLSVGQNVTLMGEQFTVGEVFTRRGNRDDNTVWLELQKVQNWLGRPGQINGILALECVCATEELGKIEQQVQSVLPDTRVFEFSSIIQARLDARRRAADTHAQSIEAERRYRAELRVEREKLAGVLVPVVIGGAAVWIFMLLFGNVRERRTEIGILRAMGVSSRRIMNAFLLKALMMGFAGALVGYVAGVLVGAWWAQLPLVPASMAQVADLRLLVLVMLLAPALACLASWLPATTAARQDPAAVLQEE